MYVQGTVMKPYGTELEAYKKFREERLIPDKNFVLKLLADLDRSISEYTTLFKKSQELDILPRTSDSTFTPTIIPLNLGSGYEADFEVYDKDFVLVSVGFGFYCEMTWSESWKFCNTKLELLGKNRLKLTEKLSKIEKHLVMTDEIISELSK